MPMSHMDFYVISMNFRRNPQTIATVSSHERNQLEPASHFSRYDFYGLADPRKPASTGKSRAQLA